MYDSTRLRIAFLSSCIIHFFLFLGIKILPKSKPIIVSFPVELLTLPSVEKVQQEKVSVPSVSKKEEIVIPKRVQKPKKQQKPQEKQEEKRQTQEETKTTSQPTTLPSLSIETAKFPFSYYVNIIRKKIVENWMWSQNYSGELKTVVYFKILRSGEIEELKIKESSSNKLYDNLCLRAVELARPFPPLPEGFKEDYLGVFFEFKYRE